MSERDADGELCPEATKLPTGFRERQASYKKVLVAAQRRNTVHENMR